MMKKINTKEAQTMAKMDGSAFPSLDTDDTMCVIDVIDLQD